MSPIDMEICDNSNLRIRLYASSWGAKMSACKRRKICTGSRHFTWPSNTCVRVKLCLSPFHSSRTSRKKCPEIRCYFHSHMPEELERWLSSDFSHTYTQTHMLSELGVWLCHDLALLALVYATPAPRVRALNHCNSSSCWRSPGFESMVCPNCGRFSRRL